MASLFFVFNTGQLTREKTKLVNTADAVAYSAGVMHARTLNFEAYINRAMIANTVAIAQLVSLSSWIQYTNNLATYGFAAENPKFVAFYPSYYASLYAGPYMQEYLNDSGTLENLAKASDTIIKALKAAQVAADMDMRTPVVGARDAVMKEVAEANYKDDGVVVVETIMLSGTAYNDFVARYTDDNRTRFAEVAKISANKDGFLPKRSWFMPALYPDCVSAAPRTDWFDRRGGTELIGFDQWQALDTLSEKRWVPKSKTDVRCSAITETPTGWGQTVAADDATLDTNLAHYDYSLPVNPSPSVLAMATSTSWDYSGLPSFYDLSDAASNEGDPRLKFAFRLKRDKGQIVTSEGRSGIKNTPRLNTYHAQTAGGTELVSVSASEAFFQRDGAIKDNIYGSGMSKPREIGSLFNPYWQVRLIQSVDSIQKAQALQGVVMQ